MSDEDDVDEDGFPIYRPDPQVVARVRAQMETLVDCKQLAREMMADRAPPDPAALEALAQGHGIDGTKTVTEIEGEDLGDTYDVADETIVHALRYVPVGQWTPSDVYLMLAYGHGTAIAAALAEMLLRDDPLVEAQHYSGDLLAEFARHADRTDRAETMAALIAQSEASIWERFERTAAETGMNTEVRQAQRQRLHEGRRAAEGPDPFLDVDWDLNVLARVRDHIDPPDILAVAEVKQRFASYRPRKSVELVPLPDLEVEGYKVTLDNPDTFQFHRDTVFQIATDRSGRGVRLRIFAASAIEHAQGIWYADVASAEAAALDDYGISTDAWRPPEAEPPAP